MSCRSGEVAERPICVTGVGRSMGDVFQHPEMLGPEGVQVEIKAGPDGSFVSTGACNLEVPGSNPGSDICHRGCAYTVLQTVQRPGVCSAAYGTVHYKEPLKSFEIRVGHSPGVTVSDWAECTIRG